MYWGIAMSLILSCRTLFILLVLQASGLADEPRQLTTDGVWKLSPRYSPDGESVYFSQSSNPGRVFLHQLDLKSGNDKQLFLETTTHLFDPVMSSDGRYLAYCQSSGSPQLILMIRDLKEEKTAEYKPAGARSTARRPAFIPGTRLVAFTESGEGGQQISVVDYEGKNRRMVTEIPANNRWPDASPDGKKLVFSSSKAGNYDLYTINLDGTELTQLTRHPLRDIHPAWSPDGTRIAFVSVRDGNHDIYLLEIATGKISRVTTSNTRDDFPSWSPDGKKLVYISQREGSTDLYELAVE